MNRLRKSLLLALPFCLSAALAQPANALGPTSFGLDAFSWTADFGFRYGQIGVTPNNNDSLIIDAVAAPGGNAFGGMGANFSALGGALGLNFDLNDYQIEMSYKLLPNNQADFLNIQLNQTDGAGGNESFNWGLGNLIDNFNSFTPDADGFVTVTRDLTELPNPITGSETDAFDFAFGVGNGVPDFDVVDAEGPNFLNNLQLQSTDGANRLNMELKFLRIVEKNATAVQRLDAGGWNRSYESFDDPGVLTRDNGVDSFTNLVIDTNAFGGVLQRGLPSVDVFDGNTHSIEVTARLLPGNEAGAFGVIVGDLDGNDDAPGAGADGAFYPIETANFSETGFATVTIPISSQTPGVGPAFGFFNTGDGSFDELNLYELQIQSISDGARLHVEIESVEIVPTVGVVGDYNGNGVVDAADFTLYRDNVGGDASAVFAFGSRDENAIGPIGPADLAAWADNLGAGGGGVAIAVPEPGALALLGISFALLGPQRCGFNTSRANG